VDRRTQRSELPRGLRSPRRADPAVPAHAGAGTPSSGLPARPSHARAARHRLGEDYPTPLAEGCASYHVSVDGVSLATTVLTRPEWLRAQVRLGTEAERFEYLSPSAAPVPVQHLRSDGLAAAVDRLADAELSDTVLTNDPVYRLLRVAVDHERLDAAVTLMPFADYALTMDLLESELVDALAEQDTLGPAATRRRRPSLAAARCSSSLGSACLGCRASRLRWRPGRASGRCPAGRCNGPQTGGLRACWCRSGRRAYSTRWASSR
jgi:hypothetical protein